MVNALKGKYWFAVLGFALIPLIGLIGAVRLAKPNSRWARDYDRDKLARSMNRFPKQAAGLDPNWVERINNDPERQAIIEDIEEWPEDDPVLWDKVTRKACKKQYGHWPENAPTANRPGRT